MSYALPAMDDRRPTRLRGRTPPRFNSVVASASVMTARPVSIRKTASEDWWAEAWEHYDSTGELRFAAGWVANGLSRINLIAARRPQLLGDEPEPINGSSGIEGAAVDLVADIAGGPDGRAQMLSRLALLLTIPGLGWVLIESSRKRGQIDGTWAWTVWSNDEIRTERGVYEVEDVDGWRPVASNHVLIKVWRSHPRRSNQPDSSTRGALRPLRQLALLDDHIEATAQSRLAGAGMLVLPNEVEFAPIARTPDPDDPDAQPDGATTDDFVEVLIDTMTTPIADRSSAAAVVPLTVKVPGEYVDKVKHLTFWSEFSDTVLALGERAIKRTALALDMPPEVVTGVSGMNHWGAWRVQEEAITLHIEPLAIVITQALTKGYLKPALLALDYPEDEVEQILISHDVTNLTVRPDVSDDTIAGWDRLEVSNATLRREIGLSESDAPSDDERRERIIMRVIDRSPQLAPQLLALLDLGIEIEAAEAQTFPTRVEERESDSERPADGAPPDTADDPPPQQEAASADRRVSAALIGACDGVVHRALERAGAKLRNKAGKPNGGSAAVECDDLAALHTHLDVATFSNVHELLDGAWTRVPLIASRYAVDETQLLTALDSYTRGLLVNGQAHDIDRLWDALALDAVVVG